MTIQARIIGLALTAIASFSCIAEAQPKDRFEVSFFGGHSFLDVSQPSGFEGSGLTIGFPPGFRPPFVFRNDFTQGFEVGARFGYRFHEQISLEAAYRYSPNNALRFRVDFDCPFCREFDIFPDSDPRFGFPFPPTVENKFDVQAHAFDVNLLYYLTRGAVQPFVTGGLGTEVLGFTGEQRSHFAWNTGGGVLWTIRRGLGARLDVRGRFVTDFFFTSETESALAIQYSVVILF